MMSRCVRRGIVVAAVSALAIPLLASPAAAAFPGRNGRIAFSDFVSGDTSIVLVRPDGSGRRQITHRDAFQSRWSPDGTRLVFSGATGTGGRNGNRIFVMHGDGTGLRRVSSDLPGWNHFSPAYSPSARQIVFSRCAPTAGCALAIMNADGSALHAITGYRSFGLSAQFSPDGAWIAFVGFERRGFAARIYLVRPDGSRVHPITPPALDSADPDWAPDGRNLVFASHCCIRNSSLWTVRPDGSGLRQLTHPGFRHDDFFPAYSPDGKQIVFSSNRRYPDGCCTDLFVVKADGSGVRLLADSHSRLFLFAGWQPRH